MYRVIIAEDEMLMRIMLKNSIQWHKFQMTIVADVANGQQAYDKYRELAPHLIVTDLKMPTLDGLGLIAKIRETDKETKFIILTCVDEFDMVRKALTLGVSDYILKLTMTPDEMEGILSKVLQQMKQRPAAPVLATNPPPLHMYELKERLIKQYLFLNKYSEKEFTEQIQQLHIRLDQKQVVLCVMEVDHYERLQSRFADQRGQLIQESLLNVLDEILRHFQLGEAIHDRDHRYLLLFSFRNAENTEEWQEKLDAILIYIQQMMQSFFNVTVSFGISRCNSGFDRLSQMYKEAISILDAKFLLGAGRRLHIEQMVLENPTTQMMKQFQLLSKKWYVLGEKFHKELDQRVVDFLEGAHQSEREIKHIFFLWLHWPILLLRLTGDYTTKLVLEYGDKIQCCESLEELLHIYDSYLSEIANHWQNNSINPEVARVIDIIEKSYDQQEITLQEIAGQVQLSSNYLSNLFKKEVGINFGEYLLQFRMEKAKKLLLETNLKLYEVMERVGITDQSYFSRTFRKQVGLKPSEFRRRWLKELMEGEEDEKD